ncbi:glycerophosphoryl diester phosphodiesterase membrane domain-containing protein [Arthrobacter sp.]|uniref:glycerophosphoryl diester phosphodiesterase membrane domain-containing protein n=1 Tax=Arthrobacter sp. TaxID=1667 RepID=UPI00339490E3
MAPPKPGVIPLRPLGVGEILDGAFQAARKNAAAVFGTAVLLQVVVSALAWLIGGLIISAFGGLQVMANEELTDESALAFGLSIIISSLVLGLLSSVGVLVLQGVLAIPTARAAVNQKTSFRLMFALAKGRIAALAGLGLLYLALTAVALVVIIAGSFFLADQLGVSSVWIIVLIILALTAVSIWIGIKLMLAPAVIIMERAPLFHALARSWQLTNRSWWRTFGIILLCTIIVTVITSVISMPISFILGLAGPLLGDPTSAESMLSTMGPLTLASMLLSSIFSAIGYAFQAAVIALVYIDLRIRREGFDVVLLREHEASGGQETRSIPGLGAGTTPGSAVPGRSGPWGP